MKLVILITGKYRWNWW